VKSKELVYSNKVQDILVDLGFSETYNYSFIKEKNTNSVELANPISSDYKYLRTSLMPNLLGNVKKNKRYFDEIRLFEIGKVFSNKSGNILEEKKLAGVVLLDNYQDAFYYLKGVLDNLFYRLGITGQRYNDIGWLGEVSNSTVAGFEIDFKKLVELVDEKRAYKIPSKYPAVIRDLAVLVGKKTKVADVIDIIKEINKTLIHDISLFDIYEGRKISRDRKNFAFHITYQSDKRNLTDKEVNQIQKQIIKKLEEKWEVRK